MRVVNVMVLFALCALALGLGACSSGKSTPAGGLKIVSINPNPGSPATGSVVALTATFSGVNGTGGLIKNWSVTAGTLSTTKPDFSLILRQTAKAGSASSVSTTATTVYWITPVAPATATISLSVEGQAKDLAVNVVNSPVSMSVTDGDAGSKVCTVRVTNITDLYQAAFRINYSSAWRPRASGATPGDFLGAAGDVLWLGLTNQNGFVPCAITKKGTVPGNDGTGTLATVIFDPVAGASAARGASAVPFGLGLVMLRTSTDEPIALP